MGFNRFFFVGFLKHYKATKMVISMVEFMGLL
jgi:hypothetical protein